MSRAIILNLIATNVLLFLPVSEINGEARSLGTEALQLENLGSDLLLPRLQNSEALKDLTLRNPLREAPKNERLTQAVKHMQAAEASLNGQDDSREASGAQARAIDDLEAMITELARQKANAKEVVQSQLLNRSLASQNRARRVAAQILATLALALEVGTWLPTWKPRASW